MASTLDVQFPIFVIAPRVEDHRARLAGHFEELLFRHAPFHPQAPHVGGKGQKCLVINEPVRDRIRLRECAAGRERYCPHGKGFNITYRNSHLSHGRNIALASASVVKKL